MEMSPIPKPDHVGPDRMGTGAVSWGHGSVGGWGRNCGFEEMLAQEASVSQKILLFKLSGYKKREKKR